MTETNPVLYILMRNDLPSMNPGKAMAQASHASNAFVFTQIKTMLKHPLKTVKDFYNVFILGRGDTTFIKWVHSTTQGFGTVLVLAVNENQMYAAVDLAGQLRFDSSVIHDPTYPILVPPELGMALIDVDVEHISDMTVGERHNYVTIPLDTCAYVFGDKNNPTLEAIVGHFPLHP